MKFRIHSKCALVLLAATFIFTAIFSPGAQAQNYSAPFPRDGAKSALDNDYFSIWNVTYDMGKSSGMYKLPLDQVYVFTSEGAVKFTKPDGTWTIEEEKVGTVRYLSKGTIESEEGTSETPARAAIIQLKDKTPPKREVVPGIPDKLPRQGTVKLFETPRVIVYDYTWVTGMKSPMHLHYHIDAAVYIVGGKTIVSEGEGQQPRVNAWAVGQVLGGTEPLKVPHEEGQYEGEPRAISVTLK